MQKYIYVSERIVLAYYLLLKVFEFEPPVDADAEVSC